MATVGTTSRPAYVYDQDTDAWVPVGVGPHTHENFVAATAIDAKGDLLAGSAPDTVGRLPIGANSTFLVADSTETLGMAWRNTITIASGSTVPLTIQNNGTGNSLVVNDEASDATPFVVSASGSVGIGTNNPGHKLDVVDTGGDLYALRLVNSNSASTTTKFISMIFGGADTTGTIKAGAILRSSPEDVNYVAAGFNIFTRSGDANPLVLSFTGVGDATFTQTVKATKGFAYSVNPQTGTSYTAVIADGGSIVTTNNSSANTFSIPTNASVAFAIGTSINIIQIGTGTTTIQATTSGTTTVASNAATSTAPKLRTQYSSATAIKISNIPEVWYVVGDIV
jgi:hypothetical protein